METVSDRAREDLARLEWPDGPVCPFCGARERVVPELRDAELRVRYECPGCGRHRGYFRRRPPEEGESTRRTAS